RGNRRRHVSPDVFVVRGVPNHRRPNYLIWQEGKGPEVVIELTSSSTRREGQNHKFILYRDTLRVRGHFLFDPDGDYLDPPLQGYRRRGSDYARIKPVNDRLPSQVLKLHLERHGRELRLHNPATDLRLPTPGEVAAQAAAARDKEAKARQQAEAARHQEA